MRLYLYTENFKSNNFDLFVSEDDGDPAPVPEEKRRGVLEHLSKYECSSQVDAQGVAVELTGFLRQRIAFKLLLEQRSTEGRTRLAFGCAEFSGSMTEADIDNVVTAIALFFGDMAISVPDGRLTALRNAITETIHGSSLNKAKRFFRILFAMILAWIVYRLLFK